MSLLTGAVLGTCSNQDAFSELPLSGYSSDVDPRIMGFSTRPWNHSNKTITSSPRAKGHPPSCEDDATPGCPASGRGCLLPGLRVLVTGKQISSRSCPHNLGQQPLPPPRQLQKRRPAEQRCLLLAEGSQTPAQGALMRGSCRGDPHPCPVLASHVTSFPSPWPKPRPRSRDSEGPFPFV